ncbi:MAG TPA: hypothetical protein VNE41_12110 [Chitinophagaceae bacterium]|nr:hypothetical protein [Chitinophagaceae bacterium]
MAAWKKEEKPPTKDNAIEPETIAENPAVKGEQLINEEHPPVPNTGLT